MDAIAVYERTLSAALLDAVPSRSRADGARRDRSRDACHERVPTLCFNVAGRIASANRRRRWPRAASASRSGHMYSPRLMARLGLTAGGLVRVSLVHYNTLAEDRPLRRSARQNRQAALTVEADSRRYRYQEGIGMAATLTPANSAGGFRSSREGST